MKLKKWLCIILAMTLLTNLTLFSSLSSSAYNRRSDYMPVDENSEVPEFVPVFTPAFFAQMREIRTEHSRDNYFSQIVMTIGSDILILGDFRRIQVSSAPEYVNGELFLPIVDIARIIGAEVTLNPNGNIIIIYDGVETILSSVVATRQETAQVLGISMFLPDNRIFITSPFQRRQLLVQMYAGYELTETYGAIAMADNGSGFYFLQYATVWDAQSAEQLLNANPNVRYAEPDVVVSVGGGPSRLLPIEILEPLEAVLSNNEDNNNQSNQNHRPIDNVTIDSTPIVPIEPDLEEIPWLTCDCGEICVMLNGEKLALDVPPIIENNRTLVPIRFIAEALDAEVDWNNDTREVTLAVAEESLTFAIGELAVGMDVSAQIINDRTFVPFRFISEFFGAGVEWCDETRTVMIVTY